MRYLTAGEVIAISAEVLGLDSATAVHGAKVPLVESAAARPMSGFGGQEFHPTHVDKAAALMVGIARNHAFLDGNKRTSLLSVLMFLNLNGCALDLSDVDESLNEVVAVADGTTDIKGLAAWLDARLVTGD